jgi:uncharacterized protein (DUF169 family)
VDHTRLADGLRTKLELDTPPIAISFVQAPPPGVPTTEAVVPSACTFWRRAEQGVFYAPASAHLNCAIGAMVMGFDSGRQRGLDGGGADPRTGSTGLRGAADGL